MSIVNIAWSASSLKKLELLKELGDIDITQHLAWRTANFRVGTLLAKNISVTASSKFRGGTGALASSFSPLGITGSGTGTGMEVGSDLPYARRREFGFSGRTDSRGRYFSNDPGQIYVMEAIVDTEPNIRQYYARALSFILGTVEGGTAGDFMLQEYSG